MRRDVSTQTPVRRNACVVSEHVVYIYAPNCFAPQHEFMFMTSFRCVYWSGRVHVLHTHQVPRRQPLAHSVCVHSAVSHMTYLFLAQSV